MVELGSSFPFLWLPYIFGQTLDLKLEEAVLLPPHALT